MSFKSKHYAVVATESGRILTVKDTQLEAVDFIRDLFASADLFDGMENKHRAVYIEPSQERP